MEEGRDGAGDCIHSWSPRCNPIRHAPPTIEYFKTQPVLLPIEYAKSLPSAVGARGVLVAETAGVTPLPSRRPLTTANAAVTALAPVSAAAAIYTNHADEQQLV